MFAQLLEELKKLIPKPKPPYDPAILGDPVALKTNWGPLKSGGTNIRTHVLRISDEGVYAFRPTFGFMLFCGLFAFIGLGALLGVGYAVIRHLEPFSPGLIVFLVLGAVFMAVGVSLFYFQARPVVFDKRTGRAWRNWREPREDFEHGLEVKGLLCPLEQVHALQIIPERISGKNSSYTSYELNLVMEDGSRCNVVDHHDIRQIRIEAASLGEYLEAAVWDSTL